MSESNTTSSKIYVAMWHCIEVTTPTCSAPCGARLSCSIQTMFLDSTVSWRKGLWNRQLAMCAWNCNRHRPTICTAWDETSSPPRPSLAIFIYRLSKGAMAAVAAAARPHKRARSELSALLSNAAEMKIVSPPLPADGEISAPAWLRCAPLHGLCMCMGTLLGHVSVMHVVHRDWKGMAGRLLRTDADAWL
jgi:hypothetical protein